MSKSTDNLDVIAEQARLTLAALDSAREKVLPLCREVIRHSSTAIRSIHRQEFDQAGELLGAARKLIEEADGIAKKHRELSHTGFIRDAQKEYAEGCITLALITGTRLPDPAELGIDTAAYLNGMGEAVGELRRYLLDSMRGGDLSHGEELLSAMDDIYSLLVTLDFPDAITSGLRRTTDVTRGILEKTRSDLTLVMRQKDLENRLREIEGKIG
ncbi:haloacid dehalogenase [Chloroflexota bacterium]